MDVKINIAIACALNMELVEHATVACPGSVLAEETVENLFFIIYSIKDFYFKRFHFTVLTILRGAECLSLNVYL
jgi:hypothetical protein